MLTVSAASDAVSISMVNAACQLIRLRQAIYQSHLAHVVRQLIIETVG